MTNKMFKLSDKYANLLIEVWETKIKVVNDSRDYPHVTIVYGDLLEPGTMVYFKSRQWFYSKTCGVGVLHGVWTNSDGEAWITYTGDTLTHSQFAELMRQQTVEPKIIHAGL